MLEIQRCCASSDGGSGSNKNPSTTNPSEAGTSGTTPAVKQNLAQTQASSPAPNQASPETSTTNNNNKPTMSTGEGGGGEQASYIPKEVKGAKAFLPPTAQSDHTDVSQPAPVPTSQSSGPKAVRGWAPPTKEWDKDTGKKKTDQTRIEVKEEWDDEGNLVRTTIKKTITPDWKTKVEKTVDIIPAAEAAKLKKK